jgi:hypothetical protein
LFWFGRNRQPHNLEELPFPLPMLQYSNKEHKYIEHDRSLESGLLGEVYSSVSEAVTAARTAVYSLNLELDQKAKSVVCGSVYVAGEVVEFTGSKDVGKSLY